MMTPTITVALRHRHYRHLWIGQGFSALGNGISPVALTLTLLSRPHAASQMGFVLAAQSVGLVGFVVVGGHLADRFRRTTMMGLADLLRIVATAGLAVFGGSGGLGAYLVLALLLGVGAGLFDPAERSLLPLLVPDQDLESANALNTVTARVGLIAGAPLGALLVTLSSPRVAFAVDALTFAVSIAAITAVRAAAVDVRVPDSSGEPALAGALGGLHAVAGRPWAAAIIAQGALQVMLVHAPMAVLVPLVLRDRHESSAYGVLIALQSVGSVVGAVWIARRRFREPGTVALIGMLAGVPTMALLLARAPASAIAVGMAASGFGGAVFAVLWSSALQRNIPDKVLGRVVALDFAGQLGLEPVGLAVTGPAVLAIGLSPVLAVAAAALLLTTVAPFAVPLVRTFGDTSRAGQSAAVNPADTAAAGGVPSEAPSARPLER